MEAIDLSAFGRKILLVAVMALAVAGGVHPALASTASIAKQQAAVDKAVRAYTAAQQRLQTVDTAITANSTELDGLVEAQNALQTTFNDRVAGVYRRGPLAFVEVLVGSASFDEFVDVWDALVRIGRQDAAALERLKTARAQAVRVARQLLAQQATASKQLQAIAEEKARAERDLSASKAALEAYRARVAALASEAVAGAAIADERVRQPAPPSPTGSGGWSTALASHYGRGSWGSGLAGGGRVGPDSMIVAHKTLPFGTLVEFRYKGRTAVARVADRGPYYPGRDFDLGPGVIRVLDFSGVHTVEYRVIGR